MNAPLPESIRKALETVTLDDKYALESGRAFMSGVQALVRLPMLQRVRDAQAGLNTAGFITGYRGSPLGGYDQALWSAKTHLAAHHVVFQPGVNEELAATADLGHAATGVRHGEPEATTACSASGTARARASTAAPTCSSTPTWPAPRRTAASSPWPATTTCPRAARSRTRATTSSSACGLPVFAPASAQDILDLGLHAFALSRFAGVWSGMKTVQEVVESAASASTLTPIACASSCREDFVMPPGGVHGRWPDDPLVQEARLMNFKWPAALAYIRANRLNYNVIEGPQDRFGIIAGGKAFSDTRQALEDLGLDAEVCRRLGIRLHKVGVVWPLEPTIDPRLRARA